MSPRRSTTAGVADQELHKNEKGEITKWVGESADGAALKVLVESHLLDNMTPSQIREEYPRFQKYNNRCFSSALANARKRRNADIHNRGQAVNCKFCVITFLWV
jgi:hypothetical protein